MNNKDCVKNLGNCSCFVVMILIVYTLVVSFMTMCYFLHPDIRTEVHPWVSWTATPVLCFAWFMSWVTGVLWDTAENSN